MLSVLLINIVEENKSQEFRLRNIDEARNYLLKQNNLISKKHTDKLSQISPFPTTSKILKCKF